MSARAADGLVIDRGECTAYSLVLIVGPGGIGAVRLSLTVWLLVIFSSSHISLDFGAVPESLFRGDGHGCYTAGTDA
jgi:hypothetical protein